MPSEPYKLYSDATLSQGAWVNHYGASMNFPQPLQFQYGIFTAEFYAAYRAIMDNMKYQGMIVHLYCDNTGVCSMLNQRHALYPDRYPAVNNLLLELMRWLSANSISLSVIWNQSKLNPADKPSRSALKRQ